MTLVLLFIIILTRKSEKKENQATEFKALFLKTKLSPIIVMTQHQKGWSESFIQHSFSSNIGESKGT
jgi:hypothetical protein